MSTEAIRKLMLQADMAHYGANQHQLIDIQQATLADGGRIINVHNAAGLHLALLPDRGLDIWTAAYQGIPLTWRSPDAPQLPDFGRTWLQQFNGGLLTTCGLTHAGPPEIDPKTGEKRGIHGPYSRLRARDIAVQWPDIGALATISGTIWETSLFGAQLALHRTYRIQFDTPTIQVSDEVTNHGDSPAPLMLVYHLNFGFPIIREGTEMLVASEVYPRDAAARAGVTRWPFYDAPTANYAEQVFWHRPYADTTGNTGAALINGGIGVAIHWNTSELPYLTQWKNTRRSHYVCGIEPGTALPEGQNAARAADRLMTLAPGATHTSTIDISVLPDENAVTVFRKHVETLRDNGTVVTGYSLDEFTT